MADLRSRGAINVYIDVKRLHRTASLNLLYTLEAAVLDMDWRDLPADLKNQLHHEVGERAKKGTASDFSVDPTAKKLT